MRAGLLTAAALWFLFGATMYMGTMWVLRLFLYPTWTGLEPGNVMVHFGVPTIRATRFFTVVVPPMFLAAAVLVWHEWGQDLLWLAVVCLLGIVLLTYVGQQLIIPVNKKIRGGQFEGTEGLQALLRRWMRLNDLRFYGSTVTWLAIVAYVALKADLAGAW